MSYLFLSLSKWWVLFVVLNFTLERNTTKVLVSKKHNISFCQSWCSSLLLGIGIKRIPSLLSLCWQELCSEYRKLVRNGKLPCTRENDPIQGPDGKMYGNTCSMCEVFLWVALGEGKWGRVCPFCFIFYFLILTLLYFISQIKTFLLSFISSFSLPFCLPCSFSFLPHFLSPFLSLFSSIVSQTSVSVHSNPHISGWVVFIKQRFAHILLFHKYLSFSNFLRVKSKFPSRFSDLVLTYLQGLLFDHFLNLPIFIQLILYSWQ